MPADYAIKMLSVRYFIDSFLFNLLKALLQCAANRAFVGWFSFNCVTANLAYIIINIFILSKAFSIFL